MLNRRSAICATIVTGLLMLGATGCKRAADTKSAAASASVDPLKVQVPAALLQSITIGTPKLQEITTQQKVAARVETDASRVARIGSPVDGPHHESVGV